MKIVWKEILALNNFRKYEFAIKVIKTLFDTIIDRAGLRKLGYSVPTGMFITKCCFKLTN